MMCRNRRFVCWIALLTLTFSLSACDYGGTLDSGDEEIQDNPSGFPETTEVLSEESTSRLQSQVEADDSTLVFSSVDSDIEDLDEGDVLVTGVSTNTPQGLLRRIRRIERTGTEVRVFTQQASLTDAIQSGTGSVQQSLTPSMVQSRVPLTNGVRFGSAPGKQASGPAFSITLEQAVIFDQDNDPTTDDDQVRATGGIRLEPSFSFDLNIDDSRIERLDFENSVVVRTNLTMEAQTQLLQVEGKKDIAEYRLQPTVILVGGFVPVVIVPKIVVVVTAKGEVRAGVRTGIERTDNLSIEILYAGQWSFDTSQDASYDFAPPSLFAEAEIEGRIGPEFQYNLYGVVGPFVQGGLYTDFVFAPTSNPWWVLTGGLIGTAGVQAEIFDNNLGRYSQSLSFEFFRAEADGGLGPTGTVQGRVTDAVQGSPLPDVQVEATQNGDGVRSTTTDSDGQYQLAVPPGDGYTFEFEKDGYQSVEYQNVSVEANREESLQPVLQIDEDFDGTGTVQGRIVDAVTGNPVPGVSLDLRAGINNTNGTIVADAETNASGVYTINGLQAGNYTAEANATGYDTAFFTITSIGGRTRDIADATINPTQEGAAYRIVLSWNETPEDLDAHLTFPRPDGTGRFHLYWARLERWGGSNPYSEYARLDRDDITSFGPETITIEQFVDGTYRYSVHDYTNRGATQSTALGNSGARVDVYRNGQLVRTFNAPSGEEGTLWTVFEIQDEQIVPVNAVMYESSPADVNNHSHGANVSIFRNMPPKRQ